MKNIYQRKSIAKFKAFIILSYVLLSVCGCEDFVKIDPPRTDLVRSTVFDSDATANAAMVDIYYGLRANGFVSGSSAGVAYLTSFSSDEQVSYYSGFQPLYENELLADNIDVSTLWNDMYLTIYKSNAIIEGVSNSTSLTEKIKKQLEGEAKFVRALSHFYLVNIFGDVPLITTTDYRVNADIPRTPGADVYLQIVEDLLDAQNLLLADYSVSNNERVRVNKDVASALLARVYLFMENWEDAEAQATSLISNTTTYGLLSDLTTIMSKNNKEAIWQHQYTSYPVDFSFFYLFSAPPGENALTMSLVNSFEPGDKRRSDWIDSVSDGIDTYYFAKKYNSFIENAEYSTVLRLGEQYLIRAEARAQQNNVAGAQDDLNMIRNRAGLGDTPANDQASLLLAIEQERRVELFTEHGHRWLDLKRTNRADAVLAPIKGSNWDATDVLYPIPNQQIINDPAMKNQQNPGY